MTEYLLSIAGRQVAGKKTINVLNPATEQVLATCSVADEGQLDQAVAAASKVQGHWANMSHQFRSGRLLQLASAIEARTEELANLLTSEQGKPLGEAKLEIAGAAAVIKFYATQELPIVVLEENESGRILEQRLPLGVVAAITPWNFPVILLAMKIAPALIVGNTVVAKPSPYTPLTTTVIGKIANAIFPPGVLNVIVDNNDLGEKLTSHPLVSKISFTGSTETGKRVMSSAAATLKRLTLELGGNDAAIVLEDVDVEATAEKIFAAAMFNAGQVCLATKRVYAHRSVYSKLCAALTNLAKNAVVGDGTDPRVTVGPVQNRAQFEKVLSLIESAKTAGSVLAGGNRLDRPGYFIQPTIIADLPNNAPLVMKEQFGPVLPVLPFDDVDDAIEWANASELGLGGVVWSKDTNRALDVALKIDSGIVWINKFLEIPFTVPFGGAKQSGIGREQGIEGMKEFTQAKVINIAPGR
ncbi:aldehyde dehydrogenase family protein [Burkholderia gladioli]|uniref:aldehyde dehydrogenase family protein n=1 Tax=Burkholderia gladioli TaxID=28095 RepID=UPI001640D17C|nr:aldehyde dehydrogenase family protein [Burkholderia gladioli]